MDSQSLTFSLGQNVKDGAEFGIDFDHFNSMIITGEHGRNELLIDIIVSLTKKNSSDYLNFHLINNPIESKFADIEKLPHFTKEDFGIDDDGISKAKDFLKFILKDIERNNRNLSDHRVHSIREHNSLSFARKIPTKIIVINEPFPYIDSIDPDSFRYIFFEIMMKDRLDGYKFIFLSERADRDIIDAAFRSFIDTIVTFKVPDNRTSWHIIERDGAELLKDDGLDMMVNGPIWQTTYGLPSYGPEARHHIKRHEISENKIKLDISKLLKDYRIN